MANSRIATSSILQGFPKSRSVLAGNEAFYPGAYESIQTVTVGSGGASSINFTSIPSTYTHLQIRYSAQSNRATFVDNLTMSVNSDTTGTNYANHILYGSGQASSTVVSASSTSQAYWTIFTQNISGAAQTNIQGTGIIDFLDYANTNKNKTIRAFAGLNLNTADSSGSRGRLQLVSGLWMNTNAITSINLTPLLGTQFNQYSSFALYGIK